MKKWESYLRQGEATADTDSTLKMMCTFSNKNRTGPQVKSIASKHIQELDKKLLKIQSMLSTLNHLVNNCQGDRRPVCPILNELNCQ